MAAEENKAVISTHRGEFFGVPATGKQITVKGMVVDRVVAGKMAESQILMDGLSMMRQSVSFLGSRTRPTLGHAIAYSRADRSSSAVELGRVRNV